MADIIKDATLILSEILKDFASQTVTYARGYDSVDVPATFGAKLLKTHDQFGGVRMEWTDLDFIIPSAELKFGTELITPERDDLIYVSQGGQVQVYEVRPFGAEPPWRWSDPYLVNYRIHTKLIDTEDVYP